MSLWLRGRTSPVTLEVSRTEDIDALRKALGIGHSGVGVLGWQQRSRPRGTTAFLVLLYLWVALITLMFSAAVGFYFSTLFAFLAFECSRPGIDLTMNAHGVQVRNGKSWQTMYYRELARVENIGVSICFWFLAENRVSHWLIPPVILGGMSPNERRILVAQLNAAIGRAHGFGEQKSEANARILLQRRPEEDGNAWLSRLHGIARSITQGDAYRRSPLSVDEVWDVLEDPDSDAELKEGAARVLAQANAPNARVRIESALSTLRDDAAQRRIRVVADEALRAHEEHNVHNTLKSH